MLEEPVELSWALPEFWTRPTEPTQDAVEGLYLMASLGMSPYHLDELEKRGQSGFSCPHNPAPDKQESIDGWRLDLG